MMPRSIFAALVLVASAAMGSELKLSARMEESNVCVSEPVKVYVRFENTGSDLVHVFGVDRLDSNMRYMFVELHHPRGLIEWRSFQYVNIIDVINPAYSGEVILPGESTEIAIYPHMTQLVGPPEMRDEIGPATRFTFDIPGTYTVRVAYWVPDAYEVLWKPPGGIVYSDPFEVVVREPDESERRILDAVWSGDSFYLLLGDDLSHLKGPDEKLLRDAIDDYGINSMVRHAMFALGRMLAYDKDPSRAREGLSMLADLNARFPNFRGEESRLHRANSLMLMGELSLAEAEYAAALRQFPYLVDNYVFMTRKLNAECRCPDGFHKWAVARAQGQKLRGEREAAE